MLTPHADLQPIHTRAYDVQAFRKSSTEILLRGKVQDTKPAGLYIQDDPEPLVIHHMTVELVITLPSMEITGAEVEFHVNPHEQCPTIIEHYSKLVGLSIARGFTHKVREMFGGPRACTHIGALVIAMAPVAIQSIWGFFELTDEGGENTRADDPGHYDRNRNTCHVWAEDGPMFEHIASGRGVDAPLWAVRRLEEYGMDPVAWRASGN